MNKDKRYKISDNSSLISNIVSMMMKIMNLISKKNQEKCKHLLITLNSKVNGIPILTHKPDTAKDIKFGVMGVSMRGTGRMTKPMEEEDLSMLTETFMTAIGKTTKLTGMVNILILMERNTMGIGWMTSSTAKATKHGQMVPDIKAAISSAKKTEKANSIGLINLRTMAISLITIFMGLVSTDGPTEENTKEIGLTTKCTVSVSLLGLTAESMKGSIMMIKSKDMVYSLGQMDESMMDTG
jgi:hypothetical protein